MWLLAAVMATAIDKLVHGFLHPNLSLIIGQPTYRTLVQLHLKLNSKAASIYSNLGNGQLSLLQPILSADVYSTLLATPFISPASPGKSVTIPCNSSNSQITSFPHMMPPTRPSNSKLIPLIINIGPSGHGHGNRAKLPKCVLVGVQGLFPRFRSHLYLKSCCVPNSGAFLDGNPGHHTQNVYVPTVGNCFQEKGYEHTKTPLKKRACMDPTLRWRFWIPVSDSKFCHKWESCIATKNERKVWQVSPSLDFYSLLVVPSTF